MFNPFKLDRPVASSDHTLAVSDELRIAIGEAGLTGDPALAEMLKTGFTSPNGKQWDPFEFIAQRRAAIDMAEAGTPGNTAENMVIHSVDPEAEPRAELN